MTEQLILAHSFDRSSRHCLLVHMMRPIWQELQTTGKVNRSMLFVTLLDHIWTWKNKILQITLQTRTQDLNQTMWKTTGFQILHPVERLHPPPFQVRRTWILKGSFLAGSSDGTFKVLRANQKWLTGKGVWVWELFSLSLDSGSETVGGDWQTKGGSLKWYSRSLSPFTDTIF